MKYQVTIKEIPEMTVYYSEKRLTKYSDMMQVIPEIGEEVRKYNPDLKCSEPPYEFCEYPDGECPKFWDEHFGSGDGKFICGMYGVCIDEIPEGPGFFKYMIADDYVPGREYPEKFTTEVIPENTWAVFPCKGAMPESLQSVNQKIFREWLPQNPDYEIAGKYNIEMYTDASKYPKGTTDENYYSEIWIPVKGK